jgi:DNA invertase Pin-like site-specific DNA recombinase
LSRAVAYVRGGAAEGLHEQRQAIRRYAETFGLRIIEWFEGVSEPATLSPVNRPELLNAIEAARKLNAPILVASLECAAVDKQALRKLLQGVHIEVCK